MALPFHAYRSNIIFLIALICGIFFPQCLLVGRILILPALSVIITITLLRFPRGFFSKPGSLLYSSLQSNLLNFIFLGNFIILAGAFLIQKQELWVGMVLVAAMPLSLEIILMGDLLCIEKNYVYTSMAGTYLGTLLIVPVVGLGFFKYTHFNHWNVIVLILCLIALPLLISRVIIDKEWDKTIHKHDDTIMDFSSFIVFYAITANSRKFLLNWSADLMMIAAIAFISTFLFYFIIRQVGVYFHAGENRINSFILNGTMKEYGLAGGIALTVFNQEVAIPALFFAIFTFIYMNWLKFRFRHMAHSDNHK